MTAIGVVGSLNTELILGPLSGFPPWGNQRFVDEIEMRSAGSAACVALPLHALGLTATVIGSVGDDNSGGAIVRRLADHGLTAEGVKVVPGASTGVCVSFFDKDGERAYVSALGAVASTNLRSVQNALPADAHAVLLTGLFVLTGLGPAGACELFRRLPSEATRYLDTGWDPKGWSPVTLHEIRRLLEVTDVFLPNASEARAITGEDVIERAARKLREMGPRTIIVKCDRDGAAGCFGDDFIEDPGFPVDVRDSTAAGEAFNAGVLYADHEGFDPPRTLRFANAVAAAFLRNKGRYASLDEVIRLIDQS